MKTSRARNAVVGRWFGIVLFISLLSPSAVNASLEQTFDVFLVGTAKYRNVTVTTKNKNYVFILHSTRMTNIKVADLSPELRTKLAYEDHAATQVNTNTPAVWAKQTISKLDVPQVKNLRAQLAAWWAPNA